MGRPKKQHLKRRKDGYFVCRYKDQWFYSLISEDDALAQRDEYKRLESSNEISLLTGPKLKDYAEKFLKNAKAGTRPRTISTAKAHLKKLTDALGEKRLIEIKPSDIKTVYTESFQGLSDGYIKKAAYLYRRLFDAALDDGYIRRNPARQESAAPPKGTIGSHRAITPQERTWIETLCTDHPAYPAVMTMLYSGIRPQEAKALDIDKAVDFKKNEITITEFVHLTNTNQYEITKTGKTSKARRVVPLFSPLQSVLKDRHGLLIKSAAGKQITVSSWRSLYNSYKSKMERAINGHPKRWHGKTQEHKKILAEGGSVPEWIEFTVVPYDLRHSFCTWARDHNVELKVCIKWMGHSDAKMVLQIYDEGPDARSKSEADRIEKEVFGKADES